MTKIGRWYRLSISNKLTIMVVLAVISAVLVATGSSAWRESTRRMDAKQAELEGISAALAASVAQAVHSADRRRMADALKGIGRIPGIRHVGVLDLLGKPLFGFGNGIVVESSGVHASQATHLVEAPIIHGGERIGTLRLVADMSGLAGALIEGLTSAIFAGLASVAIGILAVQRLQWALLRPISELTAAIDAIRRAKDYTGKVARISDDETGILVDTFNTMLGEIRDRDDQLSSHTAHLEATITERTRELIQAKQVADEANAAKSDFLATMSHEIRTPMNGMLVMAELLAADELAPRARRRCETIVQSGRLLLSIINDILDFSKIEAGHLTLEQLEIEPAATVRDVLDLFAERAAASGLELACHVDLRVPAKIIGDPVRLHQILSNLISNALKFTEKGGVIARLQQVRLDDGRDGLRYSVTDTGIGLADDKVEAVFNAFTQAEQSTSRRFGGTGVGLAICRRLVAAMGGNIGVESQLGLGSTFHFTVPIVVVEPAMPNTPWRAIDDSGSNQVVLRMGAGPVRTALSELIADFGLEAVDEAEIIEADGRLEPVRLLIADAAELERDRAQKLPAAQAAVAIARIGSAAGERLLGRGKVVAVMDCTIGGSVSRRVLHDVLSARTSSDAKPNGGEARVSRTCAIDLAGGNANFIGRRVLVADDSAVNREVATEALARLGVNAVAVGDGKNALEAAKKGGYDLVLMDGSMPVLDGFESTRLLRAWEAEQGLPPVPVIAFTAHVIGPLAEAWRDAGMNAMLAKPFTLKGLAACLSQWLPGADPGIAHHMAESLAAWRATAVEDAELIDTDVLGSIVGMQAPGDDLLGRVVDVYREHAPKQFAELTAWDRGDRPGIARLAHALKSSSRNIGALRVGDLCSEIERRAREGEEGVDALLDRLGQALPETIVLLDGYLLKSAA